MLKNYFKVAFRNLTRHKLYSFLNITGLAVGIACCIMILLYVQDELSYDRYHENADRIYRLCGSASLSGELMEISSTTHAMGEIFMGLNPEIENYTRFSSYASRRVITYNDRSFNEERFIWADSTTFEVFSFEFVTGNPSAALTRPNTVVITEQTAEKYFGAEDPIGKNLIVNTTDYEVTGVIKNIPPNSHLKPDFIASFTTLGLEREATVVEDLLSNFNYFTYFLLRENASVAELEQKIAIFLDNTLKQVLETIGGSMSLYLQPLTEIHLSSRTYIHDDSDTSDIAYVYLFSGIGIFILLIACLNFMNLVTARSANRAREVGMRKVVGALRKQLIYQFIGETMLMALISIAIAMGLSYLSLSFFNDISGKSLTFNLFENPLLAAGLIGFIFFVGIVGGSYPAFFLSAFRPVEVLKGSLSKGSKSSLLRIVLVSLQFTVSIVLIIGTLVINDQLNFMRNKKLGFEKEQILTFRMRNSETKQKHEAIIERLNQHPDIIAVSASIGLPTDMHSNSLLHGVGKPDDEWTIFGIYTADEHQIGLYEMDIVDGRNFSSEYKTDSAEAVIINEAAAQYLGWTGEAVGKQLEIKVGMEETRASTIIGVVKDFHYLSLHEAIRPMVIYNTGPWDDRYSMISVKFNTDNVPALVSYLKETWVEFDSVFPFDYTFVDEQYNALYRSEENLSKLFGNFTVLAIFIGCLGLFGLASFTAEQRTKEIGIRKVLGASVASLINLLIKEFTKWVILANLIAWPVGWYIMNNWLQSFAYRVDIGISTFVAAAIMALLIAVFTVSYQAVRAALGNPVTALKYE